MTGANARPDDGAAVFDVRALKYRYPHAARPTLEGLTFDVAPGAFFGIIGPNGSGKSTLLRLLLGTLRANAGTVTFRGRDTASWHRRELALRIGVVPQIEELAFPFTVLETVAMGRYPHLGAWRAERDVDRAAVQSALEVCDIADVADRALGTLSGGERQRARIARALAQQPDTLVLDEPTAALDIRHEMQIFEILRGLTLGGVTVVAVTHHINLAARYATQLLLIDSGRAVSHGAPGAVLDRDTLQRVYDWPLAVGTHPGPGPDSGAPQIVPLAVPTETDSLITSKESL